MKAFKLFDHILEMFSRFALIGCLLLTLILAVASIVLRWFGSSFMWLEPLIRHLVFLSAFLGGSLATSKNVHIKVDLVTKLIENSNSKVFKWIHGNVISLFSFVTCLFLLVSSWDFYNIEKEFGAPSFLDIHSSSLVFIIPFGLGLISLRFFNQLIFGLFREE
jgi:TRAP-type C4-dicarboxylate transport system permease small subunit